MHTTCTATATNMMPPVMWADRTGACVNEKATEAPHSQVSAASPLATASMPEERSPHLLQVSDDLHLAQSRQPLFKKAGFTVHTCASAQAECLSEMLLMRFRAAVFCQSVPSEFALHLSRLLAERNQELTIVRLSKRPWQEVEPEAYDLLLQAPLAPADFVTTMSRICERA